MCCSNVNSSNVEMFYIWGTAPVRSSLCILTLSAFEQYPHNLQSGHSTHQGSVLPRNLTTASHDGLPVGQSPACEHKRKRNRRTRRYHRKKRERCTIHRTVRVRVSRTYRVAASVNSVGTESHIRKGKYGHNLLYLTAPCSRSFRIWFVLAPT